MKKIIFMGTPSYATCILKALVENENFKPDFKLIWQESEENLDKNLQSLRARLLD